MELVKSYLPEQAVEKQWSFQWFQNYVKSLYCRFKCCSHLMSFTYDYLIWKNKANLRDLIAATGLVILLNLIQIIDFSACLTLKFDGWTQINSNWSYSPETLNSGQNWQFLSRVTLKFYGWPWKTIGLLFYTLSSFVHHFKTKVEFKLELQSGNTQFGSKLATFRPVWSWNFMDDLGKQECTSSILHQALCIISKPWVNSNWSYSLEMLNLGQNQQFFVPCDLEIWRIILKNNRATLLCYFKLCASCHSHQ